MGCQILQGFANKEHISLSEIWNLALTFFSLTCFCTKCEDWGNAGYLTAQKDRFAQLCPSLSMQAWPGPFTLVGLDVPLPERVELHDPQEPFKLRLLGWLDVTLCFQILITCIQRSRTQQANSSPHLQIPTLCTFKWENLYHFPENTNELLELQRHLSETVHLTSLC